METFGCQVVFTNWVEKTLLEFLLTVDSKLGYLLEINEKNVVKIK